MSEKSEFLKEKNSAFGRRRNEDETKTKRRRNEGRAKRQNCQNGAEKFAGLKNKGISK